jgi:anti-anti-sigma factor
MSPPPLAANLGTTAARPAHRDAGREESSVDIASRTYGDVVVVEPAGRIDHAAGADFERAVVPLIDPSTGSAAGLVFDLRRVAYISSVGLRVFIVAAKALRARGARIAVAHVQPVVEQILAISRFDAVVETFPTVSDALAALSSDAAAAHRAATAGGAS